MENHRKRNIPISILHEDCALDKWIAAKFFIPLYSKYLEKSEVVELFASKKSNSVQIKLLGGLRVF